MEDSDLTYFCAVMRKLGVTSVKVAFSGSGDSGNVDEVTFDGIMQDLKDVPIDQFPTITFVEENEQKTICYRHNPPSWQTNGNSMASWAECWVSQHAVNDPYVDWDWYNNDGGGGEIIIEPFTNKITVDGYWNKVETTEIGVGSQHALDPGVEFIDVPDWQPAEVDDDFVPSRAAEDDAEANV